MTESITWVENRNYKFAPLSRQYITSDLAYLITWRNLSFHIEIHSFKKYGDVGELVHNAYYDNDDYQRLHDLFISVPPYRFLSYILGEEL